ncbi:2-hydroxychromene-2-carboxylate isomerase [Hydrogenophaga sp. PAMC20947]|uniref:2-hydroxychromene-2-carboxylate isomerase n=1 Tax=Hydrogenophaga sp. PAMC20947 TaxID=2565558 RepID=UPI00109DD2D0|nr:2-hydroxychromene-2-carboxylate isomerase [Hydrogenophaga sp. PAMC20947]QCB46171.1 2-hydroxychromene-2-carboxylate isomerase [Hydrogenophaga sp. PAMC20947]
MSHKAVEFFFDVGSPTAYLAWTQLPAIAKEAGANIVWRPMLLGGVFKATGNQSPVTVPAKGQWMGSDLPRWAQRYLVPFQSNPFFPINTLALMRGATGVQMRQPERLNDYLRAVFKAMWAKPVNMGDPDIMATTLAGAGFDAATVSALINDPEVKAQLVATTDEAVRRGVFGAPSFFVGDEMFFGQDRLDFVRDALNS